MRPRTRRAWFVAAVFLVGALAGPGEFAAPRPADELPDSLSDREFWRLIEAFSESDGYFDSDNLVSNEDTFQSVIPELVATVRPGRAYLGVGPDQNFTYIAALAPRVAFITDVRRGNLHLHLMYKALFELSGDRADFVARLFARRRPAGLGAASSVDEIFRAFRLATPDAALAAGTERAVQEQLAAARFPLSESDREGIRAVYLEFVAGGPDLRFVSSRGGNRYPTFAELQTASDGQGRRRAYLADEALYRRVRVMQRSNLIVPVVGNFAGARALRAIGRYLEAHGQTVGAFYTSNVERYLFRDGRWDEFASNVGMLPLDSTSTFIRACFDACSPPGASRAITVVDSMTRLLLDAQAGRVRSYWDVLFRTRR